MFRNKFFSNGYDVVLIAPAAAAWSFIVSSSNAICASSPRRAIAMGIVCILLAMATNTEAMFALQLLQDAKTPGLPETSVLAFALPIFVSLYGSIVSFCVPEAIGALAGLLVWWLAGKRGAG